MRYDFGSAGADFFAKGSFLIRAFLIERECVYYIKCFGISKYLYENDHK